MNDIDHALIEGVRPPIYASMKYWGKKPHNIWRQYITTYVPEGSAVFDPFAGSAVAAFEAVKAGRKAIVFDLNPMTSFLIESYCAVFDKEKFAEHVHKIVGEIENDSLYQKLFSAEIEGGMSGGIVQNCKWENGEIYEVGVTQKSLDGGYSKNRTLRHPLKSDSQKAEHLKYEDLQNPPFNNLWFPRQEFPESPSFSGSFINKLGGRFFYHLWTPRNLYVLSRIFNLILDTKDDIVKKHLLLGFVQSIHLCTKMCVPRRAAANRAFSTSWGRSAYVCANRQMEMNPLIVFHGNCLGKKQSVVSSVSSVPQYLGKIPKICRVEPNGTGSQSVDYDIKYGIVDAVTMDHRHVSEKDPIHLVLTDPPYGGLVQYMDLSSIWLVWLSQYDSRFTPDYANEITIKPRIQDKDVYQRKMARAFQNMCHLTPNSKKIVLSFHNKKIEIWNAFLNALFEANLSVEKVIHQPNRRTGEANVVNPYGTSANDFYIRCIKVPPKQRKNLKSIEEIVVEKSIEIIALRNEPTPYKILFPGILAEISMAGFNLGEFSGNVKDILLGRTGKNKDFVLQSNKRSDDAFWWLANPGRVIQNAQLPLSDRVRLSVLDLLRREVSVTLDDALAPIFIKYPNGLTPDKESVLGCLKKYANKSSGKWVYKGDNYTGVSEHTDILRLLAIIGRKIGQKIYIGKREQPEVCQDNKKLREHADWSTLPDLPGVDNNAQKRVAQIDMLWFFNGKVHCALEVENTTNFLAGIHRGASLGASTPKIMVIPDERINEIKQVLKSSFTAECFKGQSWSVMTYSSVRTLSRTQKISLHAWNNFLVPLNDEGGF